MAILTAVTDAFVFPSIATGAALVVYSLFGVNVSSARERYQVKAPATTGIYLFCSVLLFYSPCLLEQVTLNLRPSTASTPTLEKT